MHTYYDSPHRGCNSPHSAYKIPCDACESYIENMTAHKVPATAHIEVITAQKEDAIEDIAHVQPT